MSQRVFFTQCPQCAAEGKDTRKDNFANYPNGQQHCFGCGYHTWPKGLERLKKMGEPALAASHNLDWPQDATSTIPQIPYNWLSSFCIQNWEIMKWRIQWSPSIEMLLFPVFNENNQMIMWQGRNFGQKFEGKYRTEGHTKDIIHLTGLTGCKKDAIILVEDVVSAIKVGRRYQCMPLWGTNIPLGLIRKLSKQFPAVGIWLDRDKQKESLVAALRASQYMPAFPIHTQLDPKHYGGDYIDEVIQLAGREIIMPSDGDADDGGMHKFFEAITNYCKDCNNPQTDDRYRMTDPQYIEPYYQWRQRVQVPEDTASWNDYRRRREILEDLLDKGV